MMILRAEAETREALTSNLTLIAPSLPMWPKILRSRLSSRTKPALISDSVEISPPLLNEGWFAMSTRLTVQKCVRKGAFVKPNFARRRKYGI